MVEIKHIPFTCTFNCGCRCELLAHVKDGEVIRIETPASRVDSIKTPRLVPCVKGRSRRRSIHAPERVWAPLRRVGPQGSGQFEEITWDEALDEVAGHLQRVRTEHGSEAVFQAFGDGSVLGRGFSGDNASIRFFSYWAPVTVGKGGMSFHCVTVASNWMLGEPVQSSDRATLLDSRLIILWGNNPAETRLVPNTVHFIAEARDRGARVVLIDPRYTDSGTLADQWIPIKPGTDAALVAAMAYVMDVEGLVDSEFIQTHTVGYLEYRKYLMGEEDGTPKTPEWAEKITGVEESVIRVLARDYATVKPAALLAGWGHQRTVYGEQIARALMTLACMSGNVGIPGGGYAGRGDRMNIVPVDSLPRGPHMPVGRVSSASWASSILAGELDPPIKMAYIVAANLVNRTPDTLRNIEALRQLDFIVVQDPYLTPTARIADIVLPICTDFERSDLVISWGHDSHLFYSQQSIERLGETRTDYWVFSELAERLGFLEEYTQGRSQEEWIAHFLDSSELDVDSLKRDGILRLDGELRVALAEFRADPEANPLKTSSGLIEIVCPAAVEAGLPSIPSYIEAGGGSEEYPLQLLTPHSRIRSHSCEHTNPWLQRLEPHSVWISSKDAAVRGVKDGEVVEVSSRAGTTRIPAMVTERIMPGVVCVYQGTWYQPSADGVDDGGCANVLTTHITSATGGYATHSDWVEVRRLAE